MPAFYAHYRFGKDILKLVPPAVQKICESHRGLFDIGLHGPDIFFFHNPLIPNIVCRFGRSCHKLPGRAFLPQASEAIRSASDKSAAMAYFFGFLCHLALDSTCHPYIYEAMEKFHEAHSAIETSFDRALLIGDGIDPLHFDPCGHFQISAGNAEVIESFFPPIAAAHVEKSLRSMVFCGHLLYTPNSLLRKVLDIGLYVTFHHASLFGMMMTPERNMRCTESDLQLLRLYAEAQNIALELIEKNTIYMESGIKPGAVFDRTFRG